MGAFNMRKTVIKNHIIDAIATYICVTAIKDNLFIKDVDTSNICRMLHASIAQEEKAMERARELLREFI